MAILVTKKRAGWAVKTLQECVPKLTDNDVLEIADEVGLLEGIGYDSSEKALQIDLTDLQMIALAAALYAVVEVRQL